VPEFDAATESDPTTEFDPYTSDPQRWGVSLAQMAELIIPLLDVTAAESVAEVGAFAGDLTRVLASWAAKRGARVLAIDPSPQDPLTELAAERPELELIRQTSLEALVSIPLPDVVIIDGDHNYFTVSEELRLISERAPGAALPLLLFHDVCWPHGRRDDYFSAELIPEDSRRPTIGNRGGIFPGDSGISPRGLPYARSADREGGEHNGVLTAVEDFVSRAANVRSVVVPAFFGFGVVWSLEAPWSERVAQILEPWDRSPMLERLEANRVLHLVQGHSWLTELHEARARQAKLEGVLQRLLESSAFSVAERLSRLRVRAGVVSEQSAISKEEIRRALRG
jgi:hypothetical protein